MKFLLISLLAVLFALPVFAGGKPVMDNGVRVIEIKRPYTNTMSIVFFVKGGTIRETEKNNGIGDLFTSSWVKSSELLKQVEFYGGGVSASVSSDFMEVSFAIPTEKFDKLIGYYSAMISKPEIDPEVFKREKALLKESIIAAEDNPDSRAYKNFQKATYGAHPYGLPGEGTLESVESITEKALKAYGKEMLTGSNITLAVAGNYTEDQMNRIRAIFSALPRGKAYKPDCTGSVILKDEQVREKDKNSKQAKLYIGYTAPDAADKDYPALKVVTDLLGGGMSSRYFNELRKDKGYAYSVYAAYASRLCSSRFMSYIGLNSENVPDALKSLDRINKTFYETLTDEELEAAKNYMLGRLLTDSQTNSKQAWYACFFENVGLGSAYFDNYVETLRKITKEDVRRAAKIFEGPKTVFILN
ncbi:M16 family metallopeptidase [Seleniivibrio woodruffii]|uniref:M16 family metallopeptidase n=1 Tax=Seleniivibrio woodruffii TaxID=1078050 RepID=UPI0039E478D4